MRVDSAVEDPTAPEAVPTLIRRYPGTPNTATADFELERPALLAGGYTPIDQTYHFGRWSRGLFILAFLLILVVIGLLLLLYLLLVKPAGTLDVTLEYRPRGPRESASIVRPGLVDAAVAAIVRSLGEDGRAQADAFGLAVRRTAEYLDELTELAAACLAGDVDAAARLRALLAAPASSGTSAGGPGLGGSLPDPATHPAASAGVDDDGLALLVAGVTWAARDPAEAEAMLVMVSATLAPIAAAQALVGGGPPSPMTVHALMLPAGVGLPGGLGLPGGAGAPTGIAGAPVAGGEVPGSIGGLAGGLGPHWAGPSVLPIDPGMVFPWRPVVDPTLLIPFWPFLPKGPRPFPLDPEGGPPGFEQPVLPIGNLCALLAGARIAELRRNAGQYEITSIHPNSCATSLPLTIRGTGFGSGGLVLFPSPDGPGVYRAVEALEWSETRIRVKAPAWATPGEIRLQSIAGFVQVCGLLQIVHRQGRGLVRAGGVPRVFEITVDGRDSGCIEPGRNVSVGWVTSAGPLQTVDVRISVGGGSVVTVSRPAVGVDSVSFQVPNVRQQATLVVTVSTRDDCETDDATLTAARPVAVPSTLAVHGLEVTQGIQAFSMVGPTVNPPITLVAGKDTIVRAYVSCDRRGFADDRLDGVTGRLTVDDLDLMPIGPALTFGPTGSALTFAPPTFTARYRTAIVRNQIDHTLNFRIPAAWCTGTRRLRLLVWGDDECGRHFASFEGTYQWKPVKPLRVRYVRIMDRHAGSPTHGLIVNQDSARALVLRAFDYLATPATDIAPAWIDQMTTTQDFRDRSLLGGLNVLLTEVANQRACWPWEPFLPVATCHDEEKWVGLVPDANAGGRTRSANNVAIAGTNALTIAHELGHQIGLRHVRTSCEIEVPDNAVPLEFDGGLLWDVAVDPTNVVTVPIPTGDLMSYGCNRWTSPTRWHAMMNMIP